MLALAAFAIHFNDPRELIQEIQHFAFHLQLQERYTTRFCGLYTSLAVYAIYTNKYAGQISIN